ncbi:anaerobic cobalt chelatase, partial [Reticulomyxa filosa]
LNERVRDYLETEKVGVDSRRVADVLPELASHRNENGEEVKVILTQLRRGCHNPKFLARWQGAMKAVEAFPHKAFWGYLVDFHKDLYQFVATLHGETAPDNSSNEPNAHDASHDHHKHKHKHNHKHGHGHDHEQEHHPQVVQDGEIEGRVEEGEGNEQKHSLDNNDDDNNQIVPDSSNQQKDYDIDIQAQFLLILDNPYEYSELVNASLEILLDVPKEHTEQSYYTDYMTHFFQCKAIPAHETMSRVIYRIWKYSL